MPTTMQKKVLADEREAQATARLVAYLSDRADQQGFTLVRCPPTQKGAGYHLRQKDTGFTLVNLGNYFDYEGGMLFLTEVADALGVGYGAEYQAYLRIADPQQYEEVFGE